MQEPSSPIVPAVPQRSRVRAKALLLTAVFAICGYAYALDLTQSMLPFAIASVAAIGLYFVRCETCKSSIYYERGGTRHFPASLYSVRFLLQRKCPVCSMRRL